MSNHEALNPIHPSVLPHLDPVFIDLYNTHVANTPNKPIDLNVLRSKYSVLYSYGTGPAPEPARVYDSQVPGHNGDPIPVRVYEPATAGPWPVHLDFHGGGMATLPWIQAKLIKLTKQNRMGPRRSRHRVAHLQTPRSESRRRGHRRRIQACP